MQERIAQFLQKIGFRCLSCTKWLNYETVIQRDLEWGTDVGGILQMDPFYIKRKVRTCECGHIMFSRFIDFEPVHDELVSLS